MSCADDVAFGCEYKLSPSEVNERVEFVFNIDAADFVQNLFLAAVSTSGRVHPRLITVESVVPGSVRVFAVMPNDNGQVEAVKTSVAVGEGRFVGVGLGKPVVTSLSHTTTFTVPLPPGVVDTPAPPAPGPSDDGVSWWLVIGVAAAGSLVLFACIIVVWRWQRGRALRRAVHGVDIVSDAAADASYAVQFPDIVFGNPYVPRGEMRGASPAYYPSPLQQFYAPPVEEGAVPPLWSDVDGPQAAPPLWSDVEGTPSHAPQPELGPGDSDSFLSFSEANAAARGPRLQEYGSGFLV